MFANLPRHEISVRIVVTMGILLSALSPTRAFAKPSTLQDPEQTGTPTQAVTETPTMEPTATPTATATEPSPPVRATETATATPVMTDTATPLPPETATPSRTREEPPVLELYADSGHITSSGSLILSWEITGVPLDEQSLVLQVNLPDGFILEDGYVGDFDENTRLLTLPVETAGGQIQLRSEGVTEDAYFTAALYDGEEVIARARLHLPLREQFTVERSGGTIEAMGGRVRVEFPSDALPERARVEIGSPTDEDAPPYSLLRGAFEIKAYGDQSGADLRNFSDEITIYVSYAELEIPEEREGELSLHWYNPETADWELLPSFVDRETKVLKGITDHFTVFDIDFNTWQSTRLPTVDSFQVSEFTGAGTYSYPIEVPPGPGGFQPNVGLIYNSQVVDQSTINTQASWVGMGWSLDTGSITLDEHGTTPGSWGADTHLLSVAGISTRIVKDPGGIYHAADENFWSITFSGSTWTVKDKQGNTYYFDRVVKYSYLDGDDTEWRDYQWLLTKVTNIFGQEILYTYQAQTKQVKWYSDNTWTWKPVEAAVYPERITYAGGKYSIRFDLGSFPSLPNREDYKSGWESDGIYHAFEKFRLQNIYVEQDADGNGSFETVIRRYQLSYAEDTDSDIIFPGYQWSKGGKTSTLRSIQQYGVGGGGTPLPPVTFTYDNLHLTRADNGYGGVVNFTYELWYYPDDARDSYTIEVDFGKSGYPCYAASASPWVARPGGAVNCGDNDKDPLNYRGTAEAASIQNTQSSIYGVNKSTDLVRPGGVYKLTASIVLQPGMSGQIGLYNGSMDVLESVSAGSPFYVILPKDSSTIKPVFVATGGTGFATVGYYKLQLLTSVYRVTTKQISDGNDHTYTYTYSYDDAGVDTAGVNDAVLSPNGTCDPEDTSCYEYIERYSEFRGHAQVTVTNNDMGEKTVTHFHQDDVLKGQPISTSTLVGSQTRTEAYYTYQSIALPIATYSHCGGCSPYRGLGRYWTYTDSVENLIYKSDGATYDATMTRYEYESSYGNLSLQTELTWNGNSWNTYRQTLFDYFFNTSAYLVGFPARQQIQDGDGAVIGETLNIYDSNTTYNQMPTAGKLTAVRTLVDGTQYSQASLGYDAWGNRTSVTTFTGYGTASSPPTAGAAATLTTYDPVFHVHPVSQTTPPTENVPGGLTTSWDYDYDDDEQDDYILGVPTGETDPNGVSTVAQYDEFGRMTQLIRPGDDDEYPTITINYTPAVLETDGTIITPYTVELTQRIIGEQTYDVSREYDGMGRQTRIVSGGVTVDTFYDSATTTRQSVPYEGAPPNIFTTTVVNPATQTTTVTAPDGTFTTTRTDGFETLVTDARGNTTVSISDVWGRVAAVEPPTGPGLTYAYDELDRLVAATRGGAFTSEANPGTGDLAAWWSMDEESGTRQDSQGANDLADNNTVGFAGGLQGNAANFTAANSEYFTIPDNPAISGSPSKSLTVCSWVNLASKTASMNIASKFLTTGNQREYFLAYVSTTDRFRFYASSNGTNGVLIDADGFGAPNTSTWYFVCGWYDHLNDRVNIQVNNGAISSAPFSGPVYDGTTTLVVGANSSFLNPMDGEMDETFIYKRTLTSAERTWLYNNGNGRSFAVVDLQPAPTVSTTTISYDTAGRKTFISDPDMGDWSYEYDALGNLVKQTDANGQSICLYYDALNRPTGKYHPTDNNCPAALPANAEVTYEYDAADYGIGRRTGMIDASGTTSWLYDTRGRMVSETKSFEGVTPTFTTHWDYNSADMPVWMQYPDGETVNYDYDDRMLLEQVWSTTQTYVPSILYDSAGRMTSRTLGNGLTQIYDYYDWNEKVNNVGQGGRLESLSVGSLQNLTYAYDAAGNIEQIANLDPVNPETNVYTYDELNRLTSWTLNGGTPDYYQYDPATGNLETKEGSSLAYEAEVNCVVGSRTIPHAVSGMNGNGYDYDCNGNQITRSLGITGEYELLYDAENRLVEVKKNTATQMKFIYDGDGRRVKSELYTNGFVTETILFVGGHYEIKNPGSGQEVTKYYFAGASRIAMRKYTIPQSMEVEYFFSDHLGSTSITTDTTGVKVSEIRYKPWGEVRYAWTSNPSTTPAYELAKYTFTGQYSDSYINLLWYGSRHYDPALGRFIQPDSIVPVASQGAQAYDRYAYVNNTPVNFTDPSGNNADCSIYDFSCDGLTSKDNVNSSKLSDYVYKGSGVSGKMMYEFYRELLKKENGALTVKQFVEMIMAHEFEPYQGSDGILNFEPGSDFSEDLLKITTGNWYWDLHKGETTVTPEGMLDWISAFGSAGMAYRAGSLTGTKASGLAHDVMNYVYSIPGITRIDPTAPSTFGNLSMLPGLKNASQGTAYNQYIAMWPSLSPNDINLQTNPAYILSLCQVEYQKGNMDYVKKHC